MPAAEDMIRSLVQGQEAVTRKARGILPLLDKVSDEPTTDLLTQRMQVHEKARVDTARNAPREMISVSGRHVSRRL